MTRSIKVSNTRSGNPGQTGWNEILPEPPPTRVLTESINADWLVVGGFAGLAAARRLNQLRPKDRTVLLEAIRIGDGPAGRSSGFMIDLPHDISAESYTGSFEADKKQTKMNRAALEFSTEAAKEYNFSQEIFDPRDKINVAAGEFGDKHNREYADYLTALGEPFTVLDAADMKRIFGTDYYSGGLYTPGTIMIQPAGFVRGLAQGLTLSGAVDIFENSPVVSMTRQNGAWQAQTPKGAVSTSKVILAVNGHIQSFGFLKRRLMHIFLYASMTRALTDDEIKGWAANRPGKPCLPIPSAQPYTKFPAPAAIALWFAISSNTAPRWKQLTYIPELYDQLKQGRVSRREFLRMATLLGLSAGAATIAAQCGAPAGKRRQQCR